MSEETTALTRAAGRSKSLRTTVPIFIVKVLKLQEGDRLQWQTKFEKDGEITVTVKPLRKQ